MRIAVVSTQNNGKTTLVNAFKKYWPMYKSPDKTYRDLIKEKNLNLNTEGDVESQRIIRDSLCDTAINNASEKYCIHDRCILDNLVYSLYLFEKDKIKDSDFVADSFHICRETLKMFDIIFWLPLNPNIKFDDTVKEDRSKDPEYREEIDAVFASVFENYQKSLGLVFPFENSPCMIALEGDLNEKIEEIRNYLDPAGDLVQTEKSVIESLNDIAEKTALVKQVRGK